VIIGPALAALLGLAAAAPPVDPAGMKDLVMKDVSAVSLSAAPVELSPRSPELRVEPPPADGARRWTGFNTALEGVFALSLAGDYVQTLHTARADYVEHNPILGKHPAPALTTAYFLGCGAAHAAIAFRLPSPWREIWQLAGIAVQGAAIGRNVQAGVGFSF